MLKKTSSLLLTFVLLLAFSLQGVSADSSGFKDEGFTEKELQEANIIENHLNFDSDNNEFVIFNKNELEKSLVKVSANTSLDSLEKDIDSVNSVMKENEGDVNLSGVCEIAMGAMGLYQGITVDAALLIAGVATTPALIALTASFGAMWYGGSLLCP